MSVISSAIPNFLNGVSQQPPSVRSRTQGDLQENGLSTPARGLEKRPGSQHIATLAGVPSGESSFIHTIKYALDEMYVLNINSAGIFVHDHNGVEKFKQTPLPTYFSGITDFTKDVTAVSASDTTLIVNKNKVPKMAGVAAPVDRHQYLVYVKQGDYGHTYRITLKWDGNTVEAAYKTPNGGTVDERPMINTDHIAGQLIQNFQSKAIFNDNFNVNQSGSTILLQRKNNTLTFTMETEDGRGDQFLIGISGVAKSFTDLPPNAWPDGLRVKIQANAEKKHGEYYVLADKGIWKETFREGITTNIDAVTMPHRLMKNGSTFSFGTVPWVARTVGDDDSVPLPSFIDETISDVFFHKNRLGILSGENVVFSETGEFYNFFNKSAMVSRDTDPIDVSVSTTRVSLLRHAVPFNEALVLFSDLTQFVLTAENILTPETVSVEVSTNFEADLRAKPVGAGRFVFFPTRTGNWAGVRQYFVDSTNDTKDAVDITAHVPNYIKGGIVQMTASSNENLIICRTLDDPKALYVYKYTIGSDGEKTQSSWSRWTFKGTLRGVEFNGSDIFMVTEYGTDVCLEKISLSADTAAPDMTYTSNYIGGGALLLDRRKKLTTATLPYTDTDTVVVDKTGNVTTTDKLADVIARDGYAYVGLKYTFKYRLSQQYIVENNQAVTTAKLVLKSLNVNFANTGHFDIEVTNRGRGTIKYTFNGKRMGSVNNILGQSNLDSGTHRAQIHTQSQYANIELVNSTPLPSAFQGAEWEGYYTLRSTRL